MYLVSTRIAYFTVVVLQYFFGIQRLVTLKILVQTHLFDVPMCVPMDIDLGGGAVFFHPDNLWVKSQYISLIFF